MLIALLLLTESLTDLNSACCDQFGLCYLHFSLWFDMVVVAKQAGVSI